MAVNANTQTVSAQSEEKQNMQESQTMPPQLRAARLGKQRIVKTIILTVTLLFLFVPLVSMFLFTIRHPLSGKWSFDPWIAIFTGDGSALGADLSTLWSGLGASLALCVVTVLIMLVLLVPTMVIVHIRSRRLERAIEWVATLPLTIPAIVLVVGLGPIYRWLSADVLSNQPDLAVLRLRGAGHAVCLPRACGGTQFHRREDVMRGLTVPRRFMAARILPRTHSEPVAVDPVRIVHLHSRGAGRIHRRLTARPYEPTGRAVPARPIQFANLHRNVAAGTAIRRDSAGGSRSDFQRDASEQGR